MGKPEEGQITNKNRRTSRAVVKTGLTRASKGQRVEKKKKEKG